MSEPRDTNARPDEPRDTRDGPPLQPSGQASGPASDQSSSQAASQPSSQPSFDPMDDPMAPPREACECWCLHCRRTFMSSDMWFQRVIGARDGFTGFWMCPTHNCSGAGFGFDIYPTDPAHPANEGWSDDDDDEYGEDLEFDEDGDAIADAPEWDPDESKYKVLDEELEEDDISGDGSTAWSPAPNRPSRTGRRARGRSGRKSKSATIRRTSARANWTGPTAPTAAVPGAGIFLTKTFRFDVLCYGAGRVAERVAASMTARRRASRIR